MIVVIVICVLVHDVLFCFFLSCSIVRCCAYHGKVGRAEQILQKYPFSHVSLLLSETLTKSPQTISSSIIDSLIFTNLL